RRGAVHADRRVEAGARRRGGSRGRGGGARGRGMTWRTRTPHVDRDPKGPQMQINVAARAGRWSAAHWKTAVTAWLAFCVVAIALGSVAGTRLLKMSDTAAGGSRTAEQLLDHAGFPDRASESVL